jgi:hypothetical protein
MIKKNTLIFISLFILIANSFGQEEKPINNKKSKFIQFGIGGGANYSLYWYQYINSYTDYDESGSLLTIDKETYNPVHPDGQNIHLFMDLDMVFYPNKYIGFGVGNSFGVQFILKHFNSFKNVGLISRNYAVCKIGNIEKGKLFNLGIGLNLTAVFMIDDYYFSNPYILDIGHDKYSASRIFIGPSVFIGYENIFKNGLTITGGLNFDAVFNQVSQIFYAGNPNDASFNYQIDSEYSLHYIMINTGLELRIKFSTIKEFSKNK